MSTDEEREERLRGFRVAIAHHFEDAASLYEQLPEEEHDLYLADAVNAWTLVNSEPLTGEQLTAMIEALFIDEDDEEPTS
jgi:uncharacterized membrane-anchored protein YhcB (DUF1043 family)